MVNWKNPPKLFIPGPVHVLPQVLEQLSRYTLGHRGKEYSQLHGETVKMLKQILYTPTRPGSRASFFSISLPGTLSRWPVILIGRGHSTILT